jgi:ribosome maturation factor RimP
LRFPFEGRRRFTGILNGVEGDEIIIVVDEDEYLLPMDSIDKARVVPVFENE